MSKDITDFDGADIINVSDVTDRVEELRDQRTDRWVAGWNMPGYLPDSEPAEFDDCDDARQHIAEAMANEQSCIEDRLDNDDMLDPDKCRLLEDESEALENARTELERQVEEEPEAELGVTIGNYHYFITQDGTMGLDDDEQQELAKLEDLLDSLCGYGGDHQWEGNWYPHNLISDDHFEDYMDQMLEDIGDMPKKGLPSYLTVTVDYSALQQDYSSVEFKGITYWYR